MSKLEFEEDCPGCKPAVLDLNTGKVLPDDHPLVTAANNFWKAVLSPEERLAFHRATCQNSRAPEDLRVMKKMAIMLQDVMKDTMPS